MLLCLPLLAWLLPASGLQADPVPACHPPTLLDVVIDPLFESLNPAALALGASLSRTYYTAECANGTGGHSRDMSACPAQEQVQCALKTVSSRHSPLAYLAKGIRIAPENPLLLAQLAWQCQTTTNIIKNCPHPEAAYCNDTESLKADLGYCTDNPAAKLAQADPGNGFAWTLYAVHSYPTDGSDRALALLQKAIAHERYDDYYAQQPLAFEIAASQYLPAADASLAAAHGYWSYPLDMVGMCKTEAASDLAWRKVCLQLGELMTVRGKSLSANVIGTALEVEILELDGDSQRLAEARERRELNRNWRPPEHLESRFEEPAFKRRFMEYMAEHGERAAFLMVTQENAARRQPGANPN